MKQTKTLAQVANNIENRENLNEYQNNETAIKCGTFESFADFQSYFTLHYRPLLQAIENGEAIDDNRRHLLNFLASDLLQMFADTDEDSESGTEDEEPARLLVVFNDERQYRRARDFYCLKASEAPTAYYAEEYNDEIRALYFTESPDALDALERDLTEDLEYYGFTGFHFEQD